MYSKLLDSREKCKALEFISSGALTAGDMLVLNDMLVYLLSGATASGQRVKAIYETGQRGLELPKQSGLALSAGDAVYWDDTANEIDATNTNVSFGFCVKDAAAGDATVEVSLMQTVL